MTLMIDNSFHEKYEKNELRDSKKYEDIPIDVLRRKIVHHRKEMRSLLDYSIGIKRILSSRYKRTLQDEWRLLVLLKWLHLEMREAEREVKFRMSPQK